MQVSGMTRRQALLIMILTGLVFTGIAFLAFTDFDDVSPMERRFMEVEGRLDVLEAGR